MADGTDTQASKRILLLLDDDEKQREMLSESGKRYFGDDADCNILEVGSSNQAIEALNASLSVSPDAYLLAVMDYNMGENLPGERKPSESIFFNNAFLKYLDNGAIIVIYSGYPEQVRQSKVIYDLAEKKHNSVILVGVKSEVQLDDLFRMLKAAKMKGLGNLKKIAKDCQYDLNNLLEYLLTLNKIKRKTRP